jgi:hypothetical protein
MVNRRHTTTANMVTDSPAGRSCDAEPGESGLATHLPALIDIFPWLRRAEDVGASGRAQNARQRRLRRHFGTFIAMVAFSHGLPPATLFNLIRSWGTWW